MKKRDLRSERERQKRQDYKTSILHAAEDVIIKKGTSALTMDDVAREAQFSKATLYRYFRSKGDLIFEIIVHYYEDVTQNLLRIQKMNTGATEKLKEAIRFVLQFSEDKKNISRVLLMDKSLPRFFRMVMGDAQKSASAPEKKLFQMLRARSKEMQDVGSGFIKEGIASGEFRPMDITGAVTFLEAALQGYLHGELWYQKKHNLEEETELIHGFFLHGIINKGNPKGEQR
jgi:AcrR family transcriptional regulator